MASHPTTTANTKANRLPAPALFIGPPSRNASHLSLATSPPANSRPPAQGPYPSQTPPRSPRRAPDSSATPPPPSITIAPPPPPSRAALDASWISLQRALDEVEAGSAARAGAFGANHGAALMSLRKAQARLAEAWAPTGREAEVIARDYDKREDKHPFPPSVKLESLPPLLFTPRVQGGKDGKDNMRDGEEDLRSARERREKNEVYFAAVKKGMLDVVAKLEDVAQAMRKVEMEGREIWDEGGSLQAGDGDDGSLRSTA